MPLIKANSAREISIEFAKITEVNKKQHLLMEMTRSNDFLLVSARKFTYQNDKKIGLKADNSIFAKSAVVE